MADSSETIPESKIIGRWADEADKEAAGTSEEVEIDALAIDESKKVKNDLTDPDDSSIEAV